MEKRTFKNKIYQELARIVKAMSNPHRLEILELLAQGSFSVEEITGQTALSVANASQHLQVLKRAKLVDARREGTYAYYHLADQNVYRAWKALRDLGIERIAEVERVVHTFRKSKKGMESVTISELIGRMERNDITIIDVRPEQEYKEGHIAGALNIPVDELSEKLKELPKENDIVAYCRGPFCVFADEAVELLSRKGFSVKRLEEGYPDWLLEGLPVENSKS